MGESERQLRDVVGILQMRESELDLSYIERWTVELGIGGLWQEVRQLAAR